MPFLSIIIPVYNTQLYLRDCLNSIKNQTFTDWECICVDDGSKDSSLQILKEYQKLDKRFRILHQENKGQSSARNLGLDNVQGDFFCFVDSDDVLLPMALEIWTYSIKQADSDVLFDIGEIRQFRHLEELNMDIMGKKNSFDSIKMEIYSSTSEAVQKFMIIHGSCGATWNKIYRSSNLSHFRFNPMLSYAEDSTYYLQIFRKELRWCKIETSNYCYRIDRENSHAKTISPHEKIDYLENSLEHLILLEDYGYDRVTRAMFWEKKIGKVMLYLMGASEECWNILTKDEKKHFRIICRQIEKSIGYYPFSWFMKVRVELLHGHLEKFWRFCEYIYCGIKQK